RRRRARGGRRPTHPGRTPCLEPGRRPQSRGCKGLVRRMRGVLSICVLLLLPLKLVAQTAEEPPSAAPPDFSQIVGLYKIETEAAPTELRVEEPLMLTVRIIGEGPAKYQPNREHLRLFPDGVGDEFHIEPLKERDRFEPRPSKNETA